MQRNAEVGLFTKPSFLIARIPGIIVIAYRMIPYNLIHPDTMHNVNFFVYPTFKTGILIKWHYSHYYPNSLSRDGHDARHTSFGRNFS